MAVLTSGDMDGPVICRLPSLISQAGTNTTATTIEASSKARTILRLIRSVSARRVPARSIQFPPRPALGARFPGPFVQATIWSGGAVQPDKAGRTGWSDKPGPLKGGSDYGAVRRVHGNDAEHFRNRRRPVSAGTCLLTSSQGYSHAHPMLRGRRGLAPPCSAARGKPRAARNCAPASVRVDRVLASFRATRPRRAEVSLTQPESGPAHQQPARAGPAAPP